MNKNNNIIWIISLLTISLIVSSFSDASSSSVLSDSLKNHSMDLATEDKLNIDIPFEY